MIRFLAGLVGAAFVLVLTITLITGITAYVTDPPAETIEHQFHEHPRHVSLASDGPFGHFDNQQLQRGFQVFKEVCAACHSLNFVSFRNLHDIGFSEAEVDAIANQWAIQVPSVDPATGEPATRAAIASDRFPLVYANETAARAANNGALPPDLSLITKAREGGPSYVYSLLTGYTDAATYRNHHGEAVPAENQPGPGLYFNPYFANLNIAMTPPLIADGQVTYAEGNPPATIDQMAQDVTAFLVWAAEPNLARRHAAGWAVILFLVFATALAWFAKKNIWRDEH